MKAVHRTFAARFSAALACMLLMGCGQPIDIKEKLGLNREGPDEYRVVPRPPLSVPPEFNLRPPGKPSEYLSGEPSQTRAHDQVLGVDSTAAKPDDQEPGEPHFLGAGTAVIPVASGALPSSGDSQFLANAGAVKADPHIRQELLDDKLNGTGVAKDPNYLFGGKDKSDAVVDPDKEASRIKQDEKENKPVTTGDTPVIVPKDNGLLGNIF